MIDTEEKAGEITENDRAKAVVDLLSSGCVIDSWELEDVVGVSLYPRGTDIKSAPYEVLRRGWHITYKKAAP